jgi:hypothetical protein
MAKPDADPQAEQDRGDDLRGLVHNKKLRAPGESFMDAMRQGEAAMDEGHSAIVAGMLKKASRS